MKYLCFYFERYNIILLIVFNEAAALIAHSWTCHKPQDKPVMSLPCKHKHAAADCASPRDSVCECDCSSRLLHKIMCVFCVSAAWEWREVHSLWQHWAQCLHGGPQGNRGPAHILTLCHRVVLLWKRCWLWSVILNREERDVSQHMWINYLYIIIFYIYSGTTGC